MPGMPVAAKGPDGLVHREPEFVLRRVVGY
jgi:hypothetical protein